MSKSDTFLAEVRERLHARRTELSEMLQSNSIEGANNKAGKDVGDAAQNASMNKLHNSLEQAEIDEMRSINDALERIDKGSYGECTDCHEPISEKRLEYSPFAARCIVCQEEFEVK